jgi:glycosyltransferase involved in cell wall biosynthesis
VRSIDNQSYTNWRLLVRDDGSRDGTTELLHRLARNNRRIQIVEDNLGNLGPAGSFSRLMELALEEPERAIAFADQDDIWHADKLARQIEVFSDHPNKTPTLVHSDLALVDREGNTLSQTFAQQQHIYRQTHTPFTTLLLQNHVVGCSMLINRSLLELAGPVPSRVHMHDWWIALCAAADGIIHYLPECLLDYRQHGGNHIGAVGLGRFGRAPTSWLSKMNRIYRTSFAQASELRQRLREHSVPRKTLRHRSEIIEILETFLGLSHRNGPTRALGLLRMGARCQHPALTALVYGQALLLKPGLIPDGRSGY